MYGILFYGLSNVIAKIHPLHLTSPPPTHSIHANRFSLLIAHILYMTKNIIVRSAVLGWREFIEMDINLFRLDGETRSCSCIDNKISFN